MLKVSKLFVILALPGVAINTARADSATTAPTTIMGSMFNGAKFATKATVNVSKIATRFISNASCQAFYEKSQCEKANDVTAIAQDTASVAGVGTTAIAVGSGLSGAGMMGYLATAGAAIGGGVVAGVAAVGGAGGVSAAHLMNKAVYSDCKDQTACGAAHVGTYTGAAVGTAGGIAAISTAGVVGGLSGAGITSGLAAIGATVGGGMAAGTAIVIAAPIVAATATGAAAYWFFSGWNPSKTTSSQDANTNK